MILEIFPHCFSLKKFEGFTMSNELVPINSKSSQIIQENQRFSLNQTKTVKLIHQKQICFKCKKGLEIVEGTILYDRNWYHEHCWDSLKK